MKIRVLARVQGGKLEMDQPISLPDGETVEVTIQHSDETESKEWHEVGMSRLEEEWNNEQDAAYDDWRSLYGV